MVFRYPIPEQAYYNQLMHHDPGLLDSLLKCANIARAPWYAQLEVDSRITETLVLMLNFSPEMVPGVEINVDDDEIQSRLSNRWSSLMEGTNILTARPDWCQRIVDIWKRLDDESPDDIVE